MNNVVGELWQTITEVNIFWGWLKSCYKKEHQVLAHWGKVHVFLFEWFIYTTLINSIYPKEHSKHNEIHEWWMNTLYSEFVPIGGKTTHIWKLNKHINTKINC